jgi:uncharacterized sulfatase
MARTRTRRSPKKRIGLIILAAAATLLALLIVFTRVLRSDHIVLRESDNREALTVVNPLAPRPNVIVILTDDQGYGDVGVYGSRSIRTPNMDRLAGEGVLFTDFYASNALCTPSRAGLLTGRYPQRTGLDWILRPEPSFKSTLVTKLGQGLGRLGVTDVGQNPPLDGLPHDEITIAEALREGGYRTGMVGKWHLGDFTRFPEYLPSNHGFDYYYGVPFANRMDPLPMYENDEEVIQDIEDQATITGRYTDAAITFIDRAQASDDPFFLFLSHTFPHEPLAASERFLGSSDGGLYGDVVEELDWYLGELLAYLDSEGLDEKTLILFTSDNGPIHSGSSGGLRGAKGQSFEGGFRVPFIARWTGTIPAGTVTSAPAMNIDFFPTLCALAGVGLPADRVIDGRDITALLTGKETGSPHDALFFYHNDELEAVRSGRWKYFRFVNTYQYPMPIDKPHTILGKIGKGNTGSWPLLYDLELDPGESYNLIESRPEVADELLQTMEAWETSLAENLRGWRE